VFQIKSQSMELNCILPPTKRTLTFPPSTLLYSNLQNHNHHNLESYSFSLHNSPLTVWPQQSVLHFVQAILTPAPAKRKYSPTILSFDISPSPRKVPRPIRYSDSSLSSSSTSLVFAIPSGDPATNSHGTELTAPCSNRRPCPRL